MAGLSAAVTHESRVESKDNKSPLRQLIGINTGTLFLDAAIGVGNHHCRKACAFLVARRGVEIGGNGNPVQIVANSTDVDPALFVLRDGSLVDKVCRNHCIMLRVHSYYFPAGCPALALASSTL